MIPIREGDIEKAGLKPNPKKVEAIQNYPLSTTPKEVERFLEMVTWLKWFIPHSSSLTTHLRKAKVMDPKEVFTIPRIHQGDTSLKGALDIQNLYGPS